MPDEQRRAVRPSKLPRRPTFQPSVAELVQKYQEFIPPQGIQDLTKTAFAPRIVVSESEQEYSSPILPPTRNKSRHRMLAKKVSTSDFEQGYAANIAPRYLTHSRRALGGSRIPGLVGVFQESRDSSRRPSPEKRSSNGKGKEMRFSRPSSPPNTKVGSAVTPARGSRVKATARVPKDKPTVRAPSSAGTKSTFRRPSGNITSKVSTMTKHFDRLGRDAERSKSRYNVIRGRRARPVASARAKVEILESIKDAIADVSESSDSSSEADDEGDGNDDGRLRIDLPTHTESPELTPLVVEPAAVAVPPVLDLPEATKTVLTEEPPLETEGALSPVPPPGTHSLPPSPFLSNHRLDRNISMTPPPPDVDGAGERTSILKALSGLWTQPPPFSRNSYEAEDPMNDPEHIFRDSAMVVRTDEPTSIIALALKYVTYVLLSPRTA